MELKSTAFREFHYVFRGGMSLPLRLVLKTTVGRQCTPCEAKASPMGFDRLPLWGQDHPQTGVLFLLCVQSSSIKEAVSVPQPASVITE